jgi:hypothetical protein
MAGALVNAANAWRDGCANLPKISDVEPITPFPLQVSGIVNQIWRQNGELANQDKAIVKQMRYYQGMELLLDMPMISTLSHLLANCAGIVYFFGNALPDEKVSPRKKTSPRKERTDRHRKELGKLCPLLGLFLYRYGYMKGGYMENTAFLVGQMLKISNELHALYCKVVRNDDVPNQLAGASLFVTATEMPDMALAQLCLRMNPYITWASSYRYKKEKEQEKGKESWRAKWLMNLFEITAEKLHQVFTKPVRFNDFEKAQMFLGYLAEFPKRETTNSSDEEKNDE